MKKLLLSAALLAGTFGANAQLADGSIAPDFTVTDIDGNTHNLYSYLDQGYTVIMDMSATWCPPCWSYHQGGALEEVWENHGPTGGQGVSASTTNDVIVLFVEGDNSTTAADLDGSGTNTQGDWLTGTNYPVIDDASLNGPYALAFFPTIYTICPNRTVTQSGQASATAHYSNVGDCPVAAGANNGGLIGYTGDTESCGGDVEMKVNLQNLGTSALTAATIEVLDGGTSVLSYNWTGNLATYAIEEVTLGTVAPTATTNYSIEITSADDNAADNAIAQQISFASEASTNVFSVEVVTDAYGSETTWELLDASSNVIASGGPYNDLQAAGTTAQPVVEGTAPAGECVTFKIYDSFGDGIDAGYGAGSYAVKDAAGTTLISGGVFTDEDAGVAKAGQASGINELVLADVNIFPNPATDVLNISFTAADSDYTVAITDLQGRVIASNAVSGVSGTQNVSFPVSDVANGSYLVTISSAAGVYTKNVVIK